MDLWRAGALPDPYVGRNAERYAGLEAETWTYRREFSVERLPYHPAWFLVFEGVDYHATFRLNDRDLGSHEGQFGRIVFDVSRVIQQDNVLEVTILPIAKAPHRSRAKVNPAEPPRHDGRWLVKSLMSFGWDFAPSLIPVGIWQDVNLIGTGGPLLHGPRVDMEFDDDFSGVDLTFLVEYESADPLDAALELRLSDPSGEPVATDRRPLACRPARGMSRSGPTWPTRNCGGPTGTAGRPCIRRD